MKERSFRYSWAASFIYLVCLSVFQATGVCQDASRPQLTDDIEAQLSLLWQQAEEFQEQSKWKEAIAKLDELLGLVRTTLGDAHPYFGVASERLANTHSLDGNYDEAAKHFFELALIRKKTFGENDWRTINAREDAKQAKRIAGLDADARKQFDQATALDTSAFRLIGDGKFDEALNAFEQSLEIRNKFLGEKSGLFLDGLNNVAMVAAITGDAEKAKQHYVRARDLMKKVKSQNHPATAMAGLELGIFYSERKEFDKAIPLMEQSIATLKATLGAEASATTEAEQVLATTIRKSKPGVLKQYLIPGNLAAITFPAEPESNKSVSPVPPLGEIVTHSLVLTEDDMVSLLVVVRYPDPSKFDPKRALEAIVKSSLERGTLISRKKLQLYGLETGEEIEIETPEGLILRQRVLIDPEGPTAFSPQVFGRRESTSNKQATAFLDSLDVAPGK